MTEDTYYAWEKVPENLKTKTQLGKMGLRLSKGQKPVAEFCSYYHGQSRPSYYDLYDTNEAQKKRKQTPAQKENLVKAREKAQALRKCLHCGRKADSFRKKQYICQFCRDRQRAIDWAKEVLTDDKAIILDSETTDLYGEIIGIAIISMKGEVLLNTRVKPVGEITAEAQAVHGITMEMLASAPAWSDIHTQVQALFNQASRVLIYNVEFDQACLQVSAHKQGLEFKWPKFNCVMHIYAAYHGEYSHYWENYKYQPLEGGDHTDLGDCLATLEVIKGMAE